MRFLKFIICFSSFFESDSFNLWNIDRRNLIKSVSTGILIANPQEEAENVEQDDLRVVFHDDVTVGSCNALANILYHLDIQAKHYKLQYPDSPQHISLHIQSGGGELLPTFYICDLIRTLDTPVYTYIDGFAASAATLISVSGHKRFMTKHSSMLIHQLKSETSGKFSEMKDEMTNLNSFMKNVKDIYLDKTVLDYETLDSLLEMDVWIDSKKCLEYGLVDEIL